jgi:ribonuclease T2
MVRARGCESLKLFRICRGNRPDFHLEEALAFGDSSAGRRLVPMGVWTSMMKRLAGVLALCAALVCAGGAVKAQQDVPGRFDYYQLVLSWSPTHCAENSRGPSDTQCGRQRARPYHFVLHGLWPQYERGYPEFCRTRTRPFVPNAVIDRMMDIMPSRGLIIHQYKKHGTCSGYSPADYFKASRLIFERVQIPEIYRAPKDALLRTPQELVADFTAANPKLEPAMVRIVCRRGGGNQLREVRICFDKRGRFRACSAGRGGGQHLCQRKKMYIPPAR